MTEPLFPTRSASDILYTSAPAEPRIYFRWLSHWRDLLATTRALRELLDAQLPLAQGLLHLSHDAPRRNLRHTFYWLYRELSGGMTLTDAMDNRPNFFPPFYVALVRAGEEGGQLSEVFADLEEELQEQLTFRRRVAMTNAYLSVTLSVQLLLIAGVLTFVVPQLIALTENLEGTPTRLLHWANVAHRSGFPAALLLASLVLPIFWVILEFSKLRGGSTSNAWERLLTWVPWVGASQRRGQLATAAAILGRLLHAGVPLAEALRTTADSALPASCRAPFRRLSLAVERGEELKEALNHDYRFFPATFTSLIALGESSGQLPEALHQISTLYRMESVHRARMALEVGAPLLIVGNGVLVFFIYGGIFLTVNSYASLIS